MSNKCRPKLPRKFVNLFRRSLILRLCLYSKIRIRKALLRKMLMKSEIRKAFHANSKIMILLIFYQLTFCSVVSYLLMRLSYLHMYIHRVYDGGNRNHDFQRSIFYSRQVSYLPQLRDVGGVRCIPFMQVSMPKNN